MGAPSANVTVQNGPYAAVNVSNGSSLYIDPGHPLTFALQSNTGVSQWVLSLFSDYANLNGQTYTTSGPLFTSQQFGSPLTPCKITIQSEVTDGNNNFPIQATVFCYPRSTVPTRTARGVCQANVNIAAANILLVAGGIANDGITTWAAGDRILLVGQTTTVSQNGLYEVGSVAANIAVLQRPPDSVTGSVQLPGLVVEISEGTSALAAATTWKCMTAGTVTVDTTNTNWYPKQLRGGIINLSANGVLSNLYLSANATAYCVCNSAPNAVQTSTINAGYGNGNVTFVPQAANSNGLYLVVNW